MTDYFYGLDYAEDRSHMLMVNSDPHLCYEVVPEELYKDEESYEPKGTADPEVEYADVDKLDWSILPEGGDVDEKGIPLSWYAIKNQTEAELWYKKHTRMPEEMISFAARFYWAEPIEELKSIERKKKHKRKKQKKPDGKIQVNKGKFVVRFD